MEFTQEQLTAAGLEYHRGTEKPRCPHCNSPMEARDASYGGKQSAPVDFSCLRCGIHGRFELEDAVQPWSEKQQATFVEAFWQKTVVRCPHDNGIIRMFKDPSLGSRVVHGRCGICGTSFQRE